MWSGLKAPLRGRIINLDHHQLPSCSKNITPISYQDGAGSKGGSIFNQLNPSLVWASRSLQRTSLGCSPKRNATPYACRCWEWSAETRAVPRRVLDAQTLKPVALLCSAPAVLHLPLWLGSGWIRGGDHGDRSWDCPRHWQYRPRKGTEGGFQSCVSCNLKKTLLD